MKLAISELAWDNDNIDVILNILTEYNISYVETVIPRHLKWNETDTIKFDKFKDKINSVGIQLKSTQSILFNSDVTAIEDPVSFLKHMDLVLDICKQYDIQKIVLGAPSLRKQFDLIHLTSIFQELDFKLKGSSQIILLEPNSRFYKGNYFFTIDEIVDFIDTNKFSNIKTMIDTHNILLEGSNPSDMFIKYQQFIDHVHVSETNLVNIIPSKQHDEFAATLAKYNYTGLVVYECKQTNDLLGDVKLFSYIYSI